MVRRRLAILGFTAVLVSPGSLTTRVPAAAPATMVTSAAAAGAASQTQSDPAQVPALVAALLGRDWDKATERLVEIGEPAVAPLLEELAGGGQRAQRACLPLARIGTPPALDGVIGVLGHEDERVRIAAAAALRFAPTPRAADALAQAVSAGTAAVRHVAAMSLGTLGDARAIAPLRAMLQSPARYTRADAIRSLAGVKAPEATAFLVDALDDESAEVRPVARQALVAQGQPATASLISVLGHASERIRWQAVWALGVLGPAEAADALSGALQDRSPIVRREAAVALVRTAAAHASRADGIAGALISLLQHANPDVRVNATWTLGEVGSKRAVPPLVAAVDDPTTGWMAATALGRLASTEAAPALARALGSSSVRTRRAAAWALSRMTPADAIAALEASLRDADPEVVYWSKQALEAAGTIEAVRAVGSAPSTPWDREAGRCAPERSSAQITKGTVSYEGQRFRLYPDTLDAQPNLPSPLTAADGTELVVAALREGRFAVVPATLRAEDRQCDVDGDDFPTLAGTGLHSEVELARTGIVTGRSAGEITDLARPGTLSVEGFIGPDEDIVDVLIRDNRAVMALGLTHSDLARPLFHLWNMMRTDIDLGRWNMATHRWHNVTAVLSRGRTVNVVAGDTKGGQLSIFDDGLDGAFWIEIQTELTATERSFLAARYPHLDGTRMDTLVRLLTRMETGEMEPHYAMWYGFYEGKTPWRTDPIAIALIFGLRTIEQIEAAFPGRLYEVLTTAGHVS